MRAGSLSLGLPLGEVEVEVGQRVIADVAANIAQVLELGQLVASGRALGDEPAWKPRERTLQLGVVERYAGVGLEFARLDFDHDRPLARFANGRIAQFAGQHLGHVAYRD